MAVKSHPQKPAAKKPAAAPARKVRAAVPSVCSGPDKAQEARWRAETDLRTMQQMAELKANPRRIRAAEAELHRQLKALQAVKGK